MREIEKQNLREETEVHLSVVRNDSTIAQKKISKTNSLSTDARHSFTERETAQATLFRKYGRRFERIAPWRQKTFLGGTGSLWINESQTLIAGARVSYFLQHLCNFWQVRYYYLDLRVDCRHISLVFSRSLNGDSNTVYILRLRQRFRGSSWTV